MIDKKLFESGCFSPEWATDTDQSPISTVYTRQNKDLQTLLKELDGIKDRIQEIQAKQWHLAKLIHFHENELVRE